MKQRLFLVSELFYPDQTSTAYIMTEIASKLSHDYDVKVICGPKNYNSFNLESVPFEVENIEVHRASSINWNKNKLFTRIIRIIILSVKLALSVLEKVKKGDKVVLVTNPALALVLISLITKWKHAILVIIVHDVFPDNLSAAGISTGGSFFIKTLKKIFNNSYARANQLIVLGRDMKKLMLSKINNSKNKPKISIIENWADVENIYPTKKELSKKIKLQFAGNFGRVQGLLSLLQCIKDANNSNIIVDFIGEGAMEKEMRQFCSKYNLSGVNILPPFKRSQQLFILNSTDIGIVSLTKGMKGLGVPSKTYNILAAGKPILYIGERESEIYQLIEEYGVGWCFDDYNQRLISFLKSIDINMANELISKGEKARALAVNKFSKEAILHNYHKVISSL